MAHIKIGTVLTINEQLLFAVKKDYVMSNCRFNLIITGNKIDFGKQLGGIKIPLLMQYWCSLLSRQIISVTR